MAFERFQPRSVSLEAEIERQRMLFQQYYLMANKYGPTHPKTQKVKKWLDEVVDRVINMEKLEQVAAKFK